MMPEQHSFDILWLGRRVRAALAPGVRGTVLAVFRRSFYVEFDNGALACVGPEYMGAGPINALARLPDKIDWRLIGLSVGEDVNVHVQCLKVGALFGFEFESALDWSPSAPASGWTRQSIAAGLEELQRVAENYDLSQGLARLVDIHSPKGDILFERGRVAAAALWTWLIGIGNRGGAPPPELRNLIGLGPGLTPSGDDFIGGAMIALNVFGHGELATALAEWVLPISRERTGKISFAHLSCAAAGEGGEALHDAISGAAANDVSLIIAAISSLDEIGHSSGWDALAGAVTGMSTLSV